MTATPSVTPGTVYLVGAGPGDPDLITLRAVACLQQADVVLYDYLASPAALEHASPKAELIRLGHPETGRTLPTDEITARMLAEARKGRTVVRLKGGDPMIFGRGADEAEALRAAGIPFEIVPGITAGLAAAAFCEIPITHHEDASAVAIVTGRERAGKAEAHLDHRALAQFPGTLIVYMGVKTAGQWCRQLIDHGKPPETPVAIVRWCSLARQQTLRCTLGTVIQTVEQQGLESPALFIVGKAVDRAPPVSWFDARPKEDAE
jgi:uroporphyrinogen III methyltransferase/synthase